MIYQLLISLGNFFTVRELTNTQIDRDFQKSSARLLIHGDNVGLAEVGSQGLIQLIAPTLFSDWQDETGTPYPTKQDLLDDLNARIYDDPTTTDAVIGPGSSVDDNVVAWNGTSGQEIKDSGVSVANLQGFTIKAARNSANSKDIYLRIEDGTPTNLTPMTLPYDCTLVSLSAATQTSETWIAEIHQGLVLVTGAFLSIAAQASGVDNSLSIDFNEGDRIEMFCSGTNISSPIMTATFIRR